MSDTSLAISESWARGTNIWSEEAYHVTATNLPWRFSFLNGASRKMCCKGYSHIILLLFSWLERQRSPNLKFNNLIAPRRAQTLSRCATKPWRWVFTWKRWHQMKVSLTLGESEFDIRWKWVDLEFNTISSEGVGYKSIWDESWPRKVGLPATTSTGGSQNRHWPLQAWNFSLWPLCHDISCDKWSRTDYGRSLKCSLQLPWLVPSLVGSPRNKI